MEFDHAPVLLDQVIEGLEIKGNGIYVDGTLGGGGHGEEICKRLDEEGFFVGIDRDRYAIDFAKQRLEGYRCRKHFVQTEYSNINMVLKDLQIEAIDGGLLDVGVSSYQLDNRDRGFSYMGDGPLDMRMNNSDKLTAGQIVGEYSEERLCKIIKEYGEERWAARIAKFIVEARKEEPIETTGQLTSLIKKAIPAKARREGPHPAKRTFQAIRIEVNQELGEIEKGVSELIDSLKKGGRLCIITFHSLEDRIVKNIVRNMENPCTCPKEFPICICGKTSVVRKINSKPIVASECELESNPRARSAKLRIIEKVI